MSRILWAQVPEPTIEQMIAVLLSNMHQGDAARIDGEGRGRRTRRSDPDAKGYPRVRDQEFHGPDECKPAI